MKKSFNYKHIILMAVTYFRQIIPQLVIDDNCSSDYHTFLHNMVHWHNFPIKVFYIFDRYDLNFSSFIGIETNSSMCWLRYCYYHIRIHNYLLGKKRHIIIVNVNTQNKLRIRKY